MKRTTLLFLILFTFTLYSQSYRELNNRVQNYFSQGQFGIAMVFAEQAAEQAKKEFGESDTNYAKALNNLAMIYQRRLRFLDAERTFLKTLKIKEKASGAMNYSFTTTLVNLGDLHKSRKNYVKALEYYMLAENIDKQIMGTENEVYAADLANIGRMSFYIDDIPNAINYIANSIKIREKVRGKDDAIYAINQISLADVFAKTGDFERADSLYKSGLKILTYKVGTPHPAFLGGLRQLAMLYKDAGNLTIADSLIFNGLSIAEPRYTKKSQVFLDFLSDYATIKMMQGDLVKAEEYGIEVYQGLKELYDGINPALNRATLHLATVFFRQGRMDEAGVMLAEFFGRCLDIRQFLYPGLPVPDIQEVEKEAQEAFGLYNSIYMTRMGSNDEVRHLAFNNYLILSSLHPGKFWFAKTKLDGAYLTEGESDYVFWLRHAEYYAGLRLLSKKDLAAWNESLDTIYNAVSSTAPLLAKDTLFSSTYYKLNFEWEEYRKSLTADDVTVVMLRGEVNTTEYPGEIAYAALVLKGGEDDDPELIMLKNGNDLEEKVFKEYMKSDKATRGSKYFESLFGEINAVVAGKKKLHFKRSGIYKDIELELLFDPAKGKTLGQLYQIFSE